MPTHFFEQKPARYSAVQFDGTNAEEVIAFLGDHVPTRTNPDGSLTFGGHLQLQGEQTITAGQWLWMTGKILTAAEVAESWLEVTT